MMVVKNTKKNGSHSCEPSVYFGLGIEPTTNELLVRYSK